MHEISRCTRQAATRALSGSPRKRSLTIGHDRDGSQRFRRPEPPALTAFGVIGSAVISRAVVSGALRIARAEKICAHFHCFTSHLPRFRELRQMSLRGGAARRFSIRKGNTPVVSFQFTCWSEPDKKRFSIISESFGCLRINNSTLHYSNSPPRRSQYWCSRRHAQKAHGPRRYLAVEPLCISTIVTRSEESSVA